MDTTEPTPENPDCIENLFVGTTEDEAIPLADRSRRYLLHHVNNNLTVLKGNMNYLLCLAERLEDAEVRSPEDKELLESVRNAINKTVQPMMDSGKTLFQVTRTVASVMRDSPAG